MAHLTNEVQQSDTNVQHESEEDKALLSSWNENTNLILFNFSSVVTVFETRVVCGE